MGRVSTAGVLVACLTPSCPLPIPIPFGAGFGLFRLGRWLAKPAPPTPAELADPFE